MRAREFTREAAPTSLSSLIMKQANPAQVKPQIDTKQTDPTKNPSPDQKNINATQKPIFGQPAQGSMPATQASSAQTQAGGTKTVPTLKVPDGQAGVPPATLQQKQQTPIGQNQSQQTPGQQNAQPGQEIPGQQATTLGNQNPQQQKLTPIQIAQQLKQQLKPGEEFNIPDAGGPIKTIGQSGPQGQKFDISKSKLGKELGVPEITIDPKELSKAISQQ
jgi:hypothetical protein